MEIPKKRGITLIEAMIAMLILTIVMGATLGAFLLGRFAIMDAKHRAKAMNLIVYKMEWAEAQSPSYLESLIGSPIVEDNVDNTVGADELASDTRTTTVSYLVIGSGKMLNVTVTLNWQKRLLGGTAVKGDAVSPDERVVTLVCR